MIIAYSKLLLAPIFELKTQKTLGFVKDVVIKKSDLSVYGLMVKSSFLPFGRLKVISSTDIQELDTSGVIVNDEDSISDLKDTVRIKQAIDQGLSGIGQKVVTKGGKKIGKVFDYLISINDLSITKLYVKNIVSERIIPISAVREIQGNKIIINDDFDMVSIPHTAIEADMI